MRLNLFAPSLFRVFRVFSGLNSEWIRRGLKGGPRTLGRSALPFLQFFCGVCFLWTPELLAQDYFRQLGAGGQTSPVLPSEMNGVLETSRYMGQSSPEEHYNLALGPVRFRASSGLGVEWNDNVAFSSLNPVSDLIFTPTLNLDAKWRVTEMNTLHFAIGLGYSYYSQHSQYDTNGPTVSPNSELAFTLHVANLAITFRDQFSLMNDPTTLTSLSSQGGAANFRRFQNQAGLTTDWIANPIFDLKLTYDHYNLWILGNNLAGYSVPDQVINTVLLEPRLKVGPAITVGLNMTASLIQESGSDALTYLIGPLVELDLSRFTRLSVEGGCQYFGSTGNSPGSEATRQSSPYSRVSIANRLNESLSHRLSYTRTIEPGYNSFYYSLNDLQYSVNWRVNSAVGLDMRLLYQHNETSGSAGSTGNRYGTELSTRYQLTTSVSLGLSYRYTRSTQNIPDSTATQNSILLNVAYSF